MKKAFIKKKKSEMFADVVASLVGLVFGAFLLYLLICWGDICTHNSIKGYDYGYYNIIANMANITSEKNTINLDDIQEVYTTDDGIFIVVNDEVYQIEKY